jgi:hypothetical protein
VSAGRYRRIRDAEEVANRRTTDADTVATGLWRNKDWRWLWLGQSVSLTGDMVFTVTVILWIATRLARTSSGAVAPWAPAAVSGALIAVAVPALLVGPFAGVWVDRWDRRATMLTADAVRCVLIAGLLVLPLAGHPAGPPQDDIGACHQRMLLPAARRPARGDRKPQGGPAPRPRLGLAGPAAGPSRAP